MGLMKRAPRKIWGFLNIINNTVKKDKNRIFIYSNLGFRDNVRAIYDYLIKNEYNKKYKIVCSLNDWQKYHVNAPQNVKFIGNVPGLFQFFRSKFCFYSFGKYPVKPAKNQTVINLWHGMPLKCIGNMEPGKKNIDYNYFSYLLCTSELFRNIMKKSFNCSDEQIFICGQPRTDIMINDDPSYFKNSVMHKIFGDYGRRNKLMLWLPTFRSKGKSETELMTDETLDKLEEYCRNYGWATLVKLHPLSTAKKNVDGKYNYIKILTQNDLEENNLDLYTVLKTADCLLTDYSSVFFDYILLDRPMGFTVNDIESYREGRGFVFDNPEEYMPGEEIRTREDLLLFAQNIFSGRDKYAEKRRSLCKLFNKYRDGENCRRVIEKAGITKNRAS